jgi:glycosyltransferase involved in cell wall biosynthesis
VGGFFPIESDSLYDEKKIEKKINNFGREIYIGYMSNLIEEKGIVEYIEAVISLKEKTNISFKAWIGGITLGNISPRLKNALVTANKKEYIEVCGLLKGDDKWNKLMRTNIFILPSYYKSESLPLSLVEAMRFGGLCISSDVGEIKNLLSNERGIILEEVKTENITNSIKKSSENIEISKNMMRRSNSYISDEFSFDSFKSKIENLVKNILVKG